jgi:perosamine synthetase
VAVLDEGVDRDAVIAGLRGRGIESTIGTYALHTEPFFRRTYGYEPGQLPASARLSRQSVALPLYPTMTEADVDRVTGAVEAVVVQFAS